MTPPQNEALPERLIDGAGHRAVGCDPPQFEGTCPPFALPCPQGSETPTLGPAWQNHMVEVPVGIGQAGSHLRNSGRNGMSRVGVHPQAAVPTPASPLILGNFDATSVYFSGEAESSRRWASAPEATRTKLSRSFAGSAAAAA